MNVNGVALHVRQWGSVKNPTVALLHGGLSDTTAWAEQIEALAVDHHVIGIDARGHGLSRRNEDRYTYELMADDVAKVFDALGVKSASIVGWSDGAIIGLRLAIDRPSLVTGVYALAANTDPSGVIAGGDDTPTFVEYSSRMQTNYERSSPTPGQWESFVADISKMWDQEPNFTDELHKITCPVVVVLGEYDEAIERTHAEEIAARVPDARLEIVPDVSHFALWQDPAVMNDSIKRALASWS